MVRGTTRGTRAPGSYGAAGQTAFPGVQSRQQGSTWKSLGLLAVVPPTAFIAIVLSYAFLYFRVPLLVMAVVACCLGAAALFMAISSFNKQGPIYLHLGILVLIATIAGAVIGSFAFGYFFLQYWRAGLGAHYNVLPTEPAIVHQDAGELSFATSAKVDIGKTIGYKDNAVYCVAPILDDSQANVVNYWAAGVDCCEPRSNFRCDDVTDAMAKSGVVIPPGGPLVWPSGYAQFQAAAQEAAAAYGLHTTEEPVFVRWVLDPRTVEANAFQFGGYFLLIAIGAHFVANLLLGITLSSMGKKR